MIKQSQNPARGAQPLYFKGFSLCLICGVENGLTKDRTKAAAAMELK
jgi:hypothetical protein